MIISFFQWKKPLRSMVAKETWYRFFCPPVKWNDPPSGAPQLCKLAYVHSTIDVVIRNLRLNLNPKVPCSMGTLMGYFRKVEETW